MCVTRLRWVNSSPPSAAYMSVNSVSIGTNNGLSPIRHQAIILTNAGLLSIGLLGTNYSESLIKIQTFSFTKMHLKLSSVNWQQFCPGGRWVKTPNGMVFQTLLFLCGVTFHVGCKKARDCCGIGNPSEIYLQLISCETLFVHNIYFIHFISLVK